MSLTTVVAISNPPGLTLSAANSGQIITTQWAGQPIIPTDLPSGFQCTIINYSWYDYTSCVLAQPLFVIAGTAWSSGATTFTLKPGQCCVLTVAPCNDGEFRYFISKG